MALDRVVTRALDPDPARRIVTAVASDRGALWARRLPLAWFRRDPAAVARGLVGAVLVHGEGRVAGLHVAPRFSEGSPAGAGPP